MKHLALKDFAIAWWDQLPEHLKAKALYLANSPHQVILGHCFTNANPIVWRERIANFSPTIGAWTLDGGVHFLPPSWRASSFSVGDGDSLESFDSTHQFDLTLPRNKSYSDLEALLALLNHINTGQLAVIHVLGLLGGRIDHRDLVMQQLCCALKSLGPKQIWLYEYSEELQQWMPAIGFLAPGVHQLELKAQQIFSILALPTLENDNKSVSIEGAAEYCGEFQIDYGSGQGLSNYSPDGGEIRVETKIPLLCYLV